MPDLQRPIRAVAFDMDGLMFNTEDIYDVVGDRLLRKRGHEFSNELKLKMMGLPSEKALDVMKQICGLDEDVDALVTESNELYLEELPVRIQMMAGLTGLMDELEVRGLPKAVATSSSLEHANLALGTFDLHCRFDFVLTAENVKNGKPAPDVYLLAAERLGVEVSELLVLEDSLVGTSAAVRAGAVTVAVPGPHSRNQDFGHADYVVDRLDSEVILMLLNR